MAFTYCTNCGEKFDDDLPKCPHCGHIRGEERDYRYQSENRSAQNGNGQNGNGQGNQGGYNPNGYGQNGYGQGGYGQGNQGGYNPNGYGQNGYGQGGYGQGNQGGYNPNGYGQNGYGQGGYGQGNQGGYNPNGYGQNGYGQGGNGQGSQGGYNPNGYGQNGYNYSYDYNPAPQSKRSLNKGSLVFSIITLLIGIVSIGAFFGGASLLLTIFAQNSKTDEDEKAKIKTAGILNVIGIVFGVLFLITYVMIFLYDVK